MRPRARAAASARRSWTPASSTAATTWSSSATFGYSKDALVEIDRFFRKTGGMILPLTVKDILEEQIARKLA